MSSLAGLSVGDPADGLVSQVLGLADFVDGALRSSSVLMAAWYGLSLTLGLRCQQLAERWSDLCCRLCVWNYAGLFCGVFAGGRGDGRTTEADAELLHGLLSALLAAADMAGRRELLPPTICGNTDSQCGAGLLEPLVLSRSVVTQGAPLLRCPYDVSRLAERLDVGASEPRAAVLESTLRATPGILVGDVLFSILEELGGVSVMAKLFLDKLIATRKLPCGSVSCVVCPGTGGSTLSGA